MLVFAVIVDMLEEILRHVAMAAIAYFLVVEILPQWISIIVGVYCAAAAIQIVFHDFVEFEDGTDDDFDDDDLT